MYALRRCRKGSIYHFTHIYIYICVCVLKKWFMYIYIYTPVSSNISTYIHYPLLFPILPHHILFPCARPLGCSFPRRSASELHRVREQGGGRGCGLSFKNVFQLIFSHHKMTSPRDLRFCANLQGRPFLQSNVAMGNLACMGIFPLKTPLKYIHIGELARPHLFTRW